MNTGKTHKEAVIDVGSNTIRTVIYTVRANGVVTPVASNRETAGLLNYCRGGRLTREGVERLIEVLRRMRAFAILCGCPAPAAFATAALRSATNNREVLDEVRRTVGLDVRLLSADEEMAADCVGLEHARGIRLHGFAFDLGGGSCQLFQFARRRTDLSVTRGFSLPFGSLGLESAFVRHGIFPDKAETEAIRAFVLRAVRARFPAGAAALAGVPVYAMGGSARAAARAVRDYRDEEDVPVDRFELSCEDLLALARLARKNEDRLVRLLRRAAPSRINTLVPGLIAIETIARHLGAGTVAVTTASVREGYLWTHVLSPTAPSTAN